MIIGGRAKLASYSYSVQLLRISFRYVGVVQRYMQ